MTARWRRCRAAIGGVVRVVTHVAAIVRLLLTSLLFVTAAQAQDSDTVERRYIQPPKVLARYPDLAIKLETPALRPGRTTYTTPTEADAFLDQLVSTPASAAHLTKLVLGTTPGGLPLHVLLLAREGVKTPDELAQLGRPIVWLMGQQHGNEPAGGEAMLALARALADGELTPLLDRLSVVIIPRANPDGAAADTRENTNGADLNRDHAVFSQPETRLIHRLARQLPPTIVVDAHEFTVGRRWVEKLGGLQAVDLMMLSSTHPMTPPPLRTLADTLFQPAVTAAIAPYGLKSFVYHSISSRAGERAISVGGTAPGIARNAFALMGAVTVLLETRGVGIGLDSYQRRVATHYIAAKAILETAANNVHQLGSSQGRAVGPLPDVILSHTVAQTIAQLPLIDPVTGAEKTIVVSLADTRSLTGTEGRAPPEGYLVRAEQAPRIGPQLALMGASICNLIGAVDVNVESYEIVSRPPADRRAINPGSSVRVRLLKELETFDAGDIYIPVDHVSGVRVMLALEPDAPGSLSAQTLLHSRDPSAIALARLPLGALPHLTKFMTCPASANVARVP
jgi:Zinc carboxypeptidase